MIRVYLRPRVVAMAFLGFSAGLPFLLVFSTLSAWLRDEAQFISVAPTVRRPAPSAGTPSAC